MINFLLALILILVVAILFIYLWRAVVYPTFAAVDEEVTTTTTTTTTTEPEQPLRPTLDQLPELKRMFKENGQPYVIDPVDSAEWMLNTNDDMYEDAHGKWWRLV